MQRTRSPVQWLCLTYILSRRKEKEVAHRGALGQPRQLLSIGVGLHGGSQQLHNAAGTFILKPAVPHRQHLPGAAHPVQPKPPRARGERPGRIVEGHLVAVPVRLHARLNWPNQAPRICYFANPRQGIHYLVPKLLHMSRWLTNIKHYSPYIRPHFHGSLPGLRTRTS